MSDYHLAEPEHLAAGDRLRPLGSSVSYDVLTDPVFYFDGEGWGVHVDVERAGVRSSMSLRHSQRVMVAFGGALVTR